MRNEKGPLVRLVLLLAIVSTARLAAAEPVIPVVDEAQLIARLAADPRLVRIEADLEAARAEVLAAGALSNPSLAYDREALTSGDGLATDYLRVTLPLELSGRRSARRAAARAEVAAVSAEAEAAGFGLTLQALRSFRLAQYERTRAELLRTERAALASAVEIVRKRAAAGATSGYDLQRIELELARYDDSIAAAAAQLEAAQGELGAWLGLPSGADAAGALELPRAPAALAASLAEALERRPEWRAATARIEGARSLGRAADRAWIPELALTAGLMNQQLTVDDSAWGYTAGLALTLPLLDRGQAEQARARAQQRQAEATRQLVSRTLPAAIHARQAALLRVLERAQAVEQLQQTRLAQLLRSAETAYREGGGTIVELVDAYTTARDLRLHALELRREAQLAQLDLWLALGRRP
jgi:outer membrane protein, heavy metal efflux system